MPAPPDVALRAQLACARRELALRARVYPRWVAEERLLSSTAEHELAAMRAIVDTLTALVAQEAGADAWQGELWGVREDARGQV